MPACPTSDLVSHGNVFSAEREYTLDAHEILEALGVEKIRRSGGQLYARCPLHHDHSPSFSMEERSTKWTCHACDLSGNGATLVARVLGLHDHDGELDTKQAHARLMEGDVQAPVRLRGPHEYQRKTDRCSGSIEESLPIATRALELQRMVWATSLTNAEAVRILMRDYSLGRTAAYERMRYARGVRGRITPYIAPDGRKVLRGRRLRFVAALAIKISLKVVGALEAHLTALSSLRSRYQKRSTDEDSIGGREGGREVGTRPPNTRPPTEDEPEERLIEIHYDDQGNVFYYDDDDVAFGLDDDELTLALERAKRAARVRASRRLPIFYRDDHGNVWTEDPVADGMSDEELRQAMVMAYEAGEIRPDPYLTPPEW
jgi:CHC2 zinc finger